MPRPVFFIRAVLASAFLFSQQKGFAQITPDHFIDFYYGMGAALPLGAFSNGSSSYHALGKASTGMNIKTGCDLIFKGKFGFSYDMDFTFMTAQNSELKQKVEEKVATYSKNNFGGGFTDIDVTFVHHAFGFSGYFSFKKITIQPKICAGLYYFGYDYMASYMNYDLNNIYGPGLAGTTTSYYCDDVRGLTLKPQISMRYAFSPHRHGDFAISFGLSYFYFVPKLTIYENRNSKITEFTTLRGSVQTLNIFCALHLTLKNSVFSNLFGGSNPNNNNNVNSGDWQR